MFGRAVALRPPRDSRTGAPRYSPLLIGLHWVTVALVLAAYFSSAGVRRVRLHPPLLHFAFGLTVLLLLAPRLIARALGGAPPAQELANRWLVRGTRLGHCLLYTLLLAVPLTGWYSASRLGVPAWLFGPTLPPLTHLVSDSAGLIGELHQLGGNLILILAGLHALMALWHQFVARDQTLQRMSPF